MQKSKLLFSQAVQLPSHHLHLCSHFYSIHFSCCFSVTHSPRWIMQTPSLFCMNGAIPWIRFSLRTGEPQAYLQALPSNLHSPSVLLIRRPWTRRHSNCSQLLQISHFIPPLWHILIFVSPTFFSPFHLHHLHRFTICAHHLHHHKRVFLSIQFIVRNRGGEGKLKGRVNN